MCLDLSEVPVLRRVDCSEFASVKCLSGGLWFMGTDTGREPVTAMSYGRGATIVKTSVR